MVPADTVPLAAAAEPTAPADEVEKTGRSPTTQPGRVRGQNQCQHLKIWLPPMIVVELTHLWLLVQLGGAGSHREPRNSTVGS